MKKAIIKILVLIFVPIIVIVIVAAIVEVYKKKKPGLYFEYKCGNGGVKLNNIGAEKAVCEGLYIPYGVKLEKRKYIKVLEKMGELNSIDVELKKDMKKLAAAAVKQTEINITTSTKK